MLSMNFIENNQELNSKHLAEPFENLAQAIEAHLIGKRHIIHLTLATFFAKGHLLLEDIPGVGKTTLAKSVASVLGLDMKRVQFTSDLLPSDILGVNYFDTKTQEFRLKKGPIFTQFLLADEINRAMPKTQSALLEAMEERQVTLDGVSYPLPKPFFVIATQNPLEEVGTFPLPLSQLDRFLCAFGIGYPDPKAEREILKGSKENPFTNKPLLEPNEIDKYFKKASEVHLSDEMLDLIQSLIAFTRQGTIFQNGLSTRGALALVAMVKSWAMLNGRDFAIPDDLQDVSAEVAVHRLRFKEGATTINRVREVFNAHLFSSIS